MAGDGTVLVLANVPGTDLADGEAHQLAIAYNAATGLCDFTWDDEACATTKTYGSGINTADTVFQMGGSNGVIGARWDGRLGYCAQFDEYLTQAERTALYAAGI